MGTDVEFQHTAARRRLAALMPQAATSAMFQHTAARRRLGRQLGILCAYVDVSTHSRPKAAGHPYRHQLKDELFQHTAARRRLANAITDEA